MYHPAVLSGHCSSSVGLFRFLGFAGHDLPEVLANEYGLNNSFPGLVVAGSLEWVNLNLGAHNGGHLGAR